MKKYITKNYKDALDAYSSYIDFNPNDIGVLIKIARIYEQQQIIDGANFIYNRIVEIDPSHEIALQKLSNH